MKAPILLVLLVGLSLSCSVELEPDSPARHDCEPEAVSSVSQALSTIDCTESTATGYSNGTAFTITVVTVDGKKVEKATANAY
jgi:hypothetical protein